MTRRKLFKNVNVDFVYRSESFRLKSFDQVCKESSAGLVVDCLSSDDADAKEAVKSITYMILTTETT